MATDLVGNVQLQRFIQLLADLNHQTVSIIKTGDTKILTQMNATVEEMYSIQHNGKEEAYTAIEEDMQIIYKNFNAVVSVTFYRLAKYIILLGGDVCYERHQEKLGVFLLRRFRAF